MKKFLVLFVAIVLILTPAVGFAVATKKLTAEQKLLIEKNRIKKLEEQAKKGDANSQFELAKGYYVGRGVEKDLNKAIILFKQAAVRNNVKAQHTLGMIYRDGMGGITKSLTEAIKWFKLAAENGHIASMHSLARMYDEGIGVAEDDKEALKWYKKGAARGDAPSQYNLGVMYANGNDVDVKKSYILAYIWFLVAEQQGLKEAKLARKGLMSEMTGKQLNQARMLYNKKYRKYVPRK